MPKLSEIIKRSGISQHGALEINRLLSKKQRGLLLKLADFSERDIKNISEIAPCMRKKAPVIANDFYEYLLTIKDTRKILLSEPGLLQNLRKTQIQYIKSLFGLKYNESYFRNMIAIGFAHNSYNISPTIYIGSYSFYSQLIFSALLECLDGKNKNYKKAIEIATSVQKLISVDITLSIESYNKKSMDDTYKSEMDSFQRLIKIAEFRDEQTGEHINRMARFSAIIAKNMGLPPLFQEKILNAAPMHDIGKVGIPDNILLKPGKLTGEEFEIMKKHCLIGHNILKDSHSETLINGALVSISHHENFDGSGYPNGLRGDVIPLEGRIVKIADVFDALTHERIYKPAFSVEKSLKIMKDEMKPGAAFDPVCFNGFLKGLDEIIYTEESLDNKK